MISMRGKRDCGPVAIANLLETEGVADAGQIYETIIKEDCFPATEGLADDLWDSPWRHANIVTRLSGRLVGIMPDPLLSPCVVLLRLSMLKWHWIFIRGYQHGGVIWHDGNAVQTMKISDRFPGCQFVLAYALDEKKRMSFVWYFWFLLTNIFLAFRKKR